MSSENLIENARKLDQLERQFRKFTYETKSPSCEEELKQFISETCRLALDALRARDIILENFLEENEVITQDKRVLDVLDRVRNDGKFFSIEFFKSLAKTGADAGWIKVFESIGSNLDTAIENIIDVISGELFEEFHADFSWGDYIANKIRVGPIISSQIVPDYIINYFEEVKESFACSQYRASIALCRSLLEILLYKKLKAKGAFRNKDPKLINIDVAKQDNLLKYIYDAKLMKILERADCDIAHKVRKTANLILHPKDDMPQATREETLRIISDTMYLIEKLYR